MRILVLGPTIHNGGPDNANRQIIAHWPKSDELVLVSSKSKGAKITEAIIKGASCDVIVSLGTGIDDRLPCRILSSFGKPYVHFCHGYIPYENDINNLGLSTRDCGGNLGPNPSYATRPKSLRYCMGLL